MYMLRVADSGCGLRNGGHPGHEPCQALVRTLGVHNNLRRGCSISGMGTASTGCHADFRLHRGVLRRLPASGLRTTCIQPTYRSSVLQLPILTWSMTAPPPDLQVRVRRCARAAGHRVPGALPWPLLLALAPAHVVTIVQRTLHTSASCGSCLCGSIWQSNPLHSAGSPAHAASASW
jgi:hypothetical protein